MSLPWIKLSTNFYSNYKLVYIRRSENGDAKALCWTFMIATAGRCDRGGALFIADDLPYQPADLAYEYGMDEQLVRDAIALFLKLNMIEINDGVISLTGWGEYQQRTNKGKSDSAERMRRYRQRQKENASTDTATHTSDTEVTSHVTSQVTLSDVTKSVTVTPKNKEVRIKNKEVRDITTTIDSDNSARACVTPPPVCDFEKRQGLTPTPEFGDRDQPIADAQALGVDVSAANVVRLCFDHTADEIAAAVDCLRGQADVDNPTRFFVAALRDGWRSNPPPKLRHSYDAQYMEQLLQFEREEQAIQDAYTQDYINRMKQTSTQETTQ